MGGENSKPNKSKNDERADTYQYGPQHKYTSPQVQTDTQGSSGSQPNRQIIAGTRPVSRAHLPADLPPHKSFANVPTLTPCSRIDPLQKSNATVGKVTQQKHSQAADVSLKKYCNYCGKASSHDSLECPLIAFNTGSQQKPTEKLEALGKGLKQAHNEHFSFPNENVCDNQTPPAIPALPVQHKKSAPTAMKQPANYLPKQLLGSNPSTTSGNVIVVDLDKDWPRIKEEMKAVTLPSFKDLNSQLYKKKPLADVRKVMVNNEYLSDVKFNIAGNVYYGHKMMLITASHLFYQEFHTKGATEMEIDDIDLDIFDLLITYCYTEKLKITEDNVLQLLKGANKLQIRQMTNVCHGFISNGINVVTVFKIFESALDLQYELFQTKCLDFINKNEEKCFSSKGFYAISLTSLIKILEACKYPREKVDKIVDQHFHGEIGSDVPAPENEKPGNQPKSKQNVPPKNTPTKTEPPKNAQGKKKQQMPKMEQKTSNIPDLLTMPIPNFQTGPPLIPPFEQPRYPTNFQPHRPFAVPNFEVYGAPGSNQFVGTRPKVPMAVPNGNPKIAGKQKGQKQPAGMPKVQPNQPFGNPQRFPGPLQRFPGPQRHSFGGGAQAQQQFGYQGSPQFNPDVFGFPPPNTNISEPLIVFDDDDDSSSIISKDDDFESKVKVSVIGLTHKWSTEFSRLDFICTRSMALHSFCFSENLAPICKEIRITISVMDQNKRSDVHNRVVNNFQPGKPFNFIKFNRKPLQFYIGQKVFIKINFSETVQLKNINAESVTPNNYLQLRKDADVKNYFNCISNLTVSDIPTA